MNDEKLEQLLRDLPAPELPANWRAEILSAARCEASSPSPTRQAWPALLIYLRNLCVSNPLSTSALTALWALIFLFKATTPIDPTEKIILAHNEPSSSVYLVSLKNEILLAQLIQDEPDQRPMRQIP